MHGCGYVDGIMPCPPAFFGQTSGTLDQVNAKDGIGLLHWQTFVTSGSGAVGMNLTEKNWVSAAIFPIAAPSDIRLLMGTYPLATGNFMPSNSPLKPSTPSDTTRSSTPSSHIS